MTFENRKKQRELNKLAKKNDIKGLAEFIKNNYGNEELDFDIIYEVYDMSKDTLLKMFDENGEIIIDEKNNLRIFFAPLLKKAMIELVPDWQNHVSELIANYVKFSFEHPALDDIFRNFRYDAIYDCFDGTKLTNVFYEKILKEPQYYKIIIKDPVLKKGFSDLELKFIKKFNSLDKNLSDFMYTKHFSRETLNKLFDGNKMTTEYYRLLANEIAMDTVYEKDENIEKYYKYCSEMEITFINLIKENYILRALCKKNNINVNNLNEFFELKNDKLKLKKEIVRNLLEQNQYDLLQFLDSNDYVEYGLNSNQILIVDTMKSIKAFNMKQIFLDVIKSKSEIANFNKEELDKLIEILYLLINELENTNSKEMHKFKDDILITLMRSSNPQRALELMNEIYTKNNLPDVGKAYLVFKTLHPDYSNFNLEEHSKASPVLKNCKTDNQRDIIIFSDLLKASFGSNNRSIRDYLLNIKEGHKLFLNYSEHNLNDKEKQILQIYLKHLIALYNNTIEGRKNPIKETGDLFSDLKIMENIYGPTARYDLPDRIIRSFGYFAGFKNFNEAWEYFVRKTEITDKKNRLQAEKVMLDKLIIEEGDFVKGIGDLEYFQTILQNGSVAKEFLSIGSSSDATPLDTDMIRVSKYQSLDYLFNESKASSYGPIFFVLKKRDEITITRDKPTGLEQSADYSNLEAFSTLTDEHFGIRTGFASSEIDYIVVEHDRIDELLPSIKHIIVTQGLYFPVIDSKNGKIIFTPREYDEMKKKISGLKYYSNDDFVFSDNLNVDSSINEIKENIDKSIQDATVKKEKINELLSKKFKEAGIEFKDHFDSDISLGNVQLIDTGSTGRGTQTGISSDFDFIMRIDSNMSETQLKEIIFDALNVSLDEDTMKNVRLKDVKISEDLEPIDIDISFVQKSNTNFYSTDAALKDRLEQLKLQDEQKYKDVLANIILAKKVLKEAGAYKPDHSRDNAQGGLGGVGIENWILQHNGSFYDAAQSFVEAAGNKSFDKFCEEYKIWDYGYNYYTGTYDEFVSQNMTAEGYRKMKVALDTYLRKTKVEKEEKVYSYDLLLDNENYLEIEENVSRGI